MTKHNGKHIPPGHIYGAGGGGGGVYDKSAVKRKRKRFSIGVDIAVGVITLAIGFAAGKAYGGERWDRFKGWTADNWRIPACIAAGAASAHLAQGDEWSYRNEGTRIVYSQMSRAEFQEVNPNGEWPFPYGEGKVTVYENRPIITRKAEPKFSQSERAAIGIAAAGVCHFTLNR